MICPVFPPQSTIGGLRAAMFSKYLVHYGWNPVVLARVYPPKDKKFQTGYFINGLPTKENFIPAFWGTEDERKTINERKFHTRVRDFIKPDYTQPYGIINKMINVALKDISKKNIDVIWATAPAQGYHTVASFLSKRFDVPWIADYRDIPEQHKSEGFRNKLLALRVKYRRKQIVDTADAVVTVSRHHAYVLGNAFKRTVEVIRNGYDPESFKPIKNHFSEKFIINYMGRIVNKNVCNPDILFKALDKLIESNDLRLKDLSLNFYGTEGTILSGMLKNYRCREVINIIDPITYDKVPETLQKSTINLLLTKNGRKGILTTKFFEYLAVNRPVLCVPEGSQELTEIIQDTNSGVVCNTVEHTAQTLKKWYGEWQQTGTVKCSTNDNKITRYSRKEQAGQLAELLSYVKHNI